MLREYIHPAWQRHHGASIRLRLILPEICKAHVAKQAEAASASWQLWQGLGNSTWGQPMGITVSLNGSCERLLLELTF